jgi:hypothetical protein
MDATAKETLSVAEVTLRWISHEEIRVSFLGACRDLFVTDAGILRCGDYWGIQEAHLEHIW